VCVGVKVGDELVTVESMMVAEQDMIQIESILKTTSSVDVTVRSVHAESSANQHLSSSSSSRPPSQLSLPPPAASHSQQYQVVQVPVTTSAELASNGASAGMKRNHAYLET